MLSRAFQGRIKRHLSYSGHSMGQTDRVSRGSSPRRSKPFSHFSLPPNSLSPPPPRTAIPKKPIPRQKQNPERRLRFTSQLTGTAHVSGPADINKMWCLSEGSLCHRGKTSNYGYELSTAGANGRGRLGTLLFS